MRWLIGFFLLLLPVSAYGWGVVSWQEVAGGSTCDTVAAESIGINASSTTFARYANDAVYAGEVATAGSAISVCGIEVYLTKSGDPQGIITAYIYSDTGTEPGTQVANAVSENTVDAATMTDGWQEFTFASNVELSAGTSYFIVLESDSVAGTNYIVWNGTAGVNIDVYRAPSLPPTWLDLANQQLSYRIKEQ